MHIQILDLISWHRETNLFRTLLYLIIIKKIMQMLEVPKTGHNQAVTGWLYQYDANNYLFMLNCLQYKGNYIIFMHIHNFDIYYTHLKSFKN
jgi:hypothetical protein